MTDRVAADQFILDRFPAGTVSRCWLRMFELEGFGPVEIPVIVVRGRAAGPLLFAVASRTRESPLSLDGRNLARVFPGDPFGLPTERLAAALFHLIRRTVGEG